MSSCVGGPKLSIRREYKRARRLEYMQNNRKKNRKLRKETGMLQVDVQGALHACSPPVSLNLLNIAEQDRKNDMTSRAWQDLRKDVDQPKGHVCPAAQAGTANATPGHMSVSEVMVASATHLTTRGALLLQCAQKLLPLTHPAKESQPRTTSILPRAIQPRAMQNVKKGCQTELDVIKLRKDPAPLLRNTANTFTVPDLQQSMFTDIRSLTNGGYGIVYTAKWHNESVVIKMFKGETAEKNACRELGQVQLGRRSWSVVPVVGYTWWKSGKGQTPCLVYRYAGNTLWSALSDRDSHPLASPLGLCEEICAAVYSLHIEAGLIHLDIKGDNVILRTSDTNPGMYKVRLIDCGTSQPVSNNHNPYLRQGRNKSKEKHWFAPEYANATSFTPRTDTWSVAFLLADVLLPMEGGQYHKEAPLRGDIAKKFGTEVAEKVLMCFCLEPRWRPSLPIMIALFKDKKSA